MANRPVHMGQIESGIRQDTTKGIHLKSFLGIWRCLLLLFPSGLVSGSLTGQSWLYRLENSTPRTLWSKLRRPGPDSTTLEGHIDRAHWNVWVALMAVINGSPSISEQHVRFSGTKIGSKKLDKTIANQSSKALFNISIALLYVKYIFQNVKQRFNLIQRNKLLLRVHSAPQTQL